jgi:hypothetical protein
MARRPNLESSEDPDPTGGPTIEQTVNDIVSQTINDIAAKTGNTPDYINLDVLRDLLHRLLLHCDLFWGRYEGALAHAQSRRNAIDAHGAAKTLLTTLSQDGALRGRAEATGLLPPLETSPLEAFYRGFDPKKLDVGAKKIMEDTKRRLGIWGRPLDRLVELLLEFYEDAEGFGLAATSSRPARRGKAPDSPFVCFAHRVTTALDIKCKPLTIHLAYERIRQRQRHQHHTAK